MKISNDYLAVEFDRIYSRDFPEESFNNLQFAPNIDKYALLQMIEELDIEQINEIYPELRAAYIMVDFDFFRSVDSESSIALPLATGNATSHLSSKEIDYRIVNVDGQDIIGITNNTICIEVDTDNNPDTGEFIFITRKV